MLVIESSNAIGETFKFDLDDQNLDYENNGIKLKDETLKLIQFYEILPVTLLFFLVNKIF